MAWHSMASLAREDTEAIDFLICRVCSVLADMMPSLDPREVNGKKLGVCLGGGVGLFLLFVIPTCVVVVQWVVLPVTENPRQWGLPSCCSRAECVVSNVQRLHF